MDSSTGITQFNNQNSYAMIIAKSMPSMMYFYDMSISESK